MFGDLYFSQFALALKIARAIAQSNEDGSVPNYAGTQSLAGSHEVESLAGSGGSISLLRNTDSREVDIRG